MITVKNLPIKTVSRKNTKSRKNTLKKVENTTVCETVQFSHALDYVLRDLDAVGEVDGTDGYQLEKFEETPVRPDEIVLEEPEDIKPERDTSLETLLRALDNLDLNELEKAVTADASPVELEALENAIAAAEKTEAAAVDPLSSVMTPVRSSEEMVKKEKKAETSSRDTVKTVGFAGVLKNRIGEDISSLYITEDCDEETKKKENETVIAMLDDRVLCSQKKVAEKMLAFFPFLTGHSNECNKVLKIAFTLLHQEGALTTTKNGNLFKALRANGYSAGTANAQSGQVFTLFLLLKIVGENKGSGAVRRFEENPKSHICQTALSRLGLRESAVEEAA